MIIAWGCHVKNDNNIAPTTELITQNLKTIHTIAVAESRQSYNPNPILAQPAPDINPLEQSLPRRTRRVLAQLRAGKSPILCSYLHMIDPGSHPSPLCPLCKSQDHTTSHLFSSQKNQHNTECTGSVGRPGRGCGAAAAVGGCPGGSRGRDWGPT